MRSQGLVIPDDLVQAARSGDSLAISQLWDACTPILEDALHQHPGLVSAVEPADAAQEAALTFLRVLQSTAVAQREGDATDDREDFASTLARALYWRLRDYIRAERRRRSRQAFADTFAMERALARSATGARTGGPPGRALARALASLSPRQRAVVAALYFKEMAVPEVSKAMDISPQAVTALHRRALLELRQQLASAAPDRRATDPNPTEQGSTADGAEDH